MTTLFQKFNPLPSPTFSFPEEWTTWVDEVLPQWVKNRFSPKESWKDKPFRKEDAHFFFRGVEELSEYFTEERPKTKALQYFHHPRFRSAYLLYFLPLQAAKFTRIFQLYPAAIRATLRHASKRGVLRIADLGAGPGTASLSFLLLLLDQNRHRLKNLPEIELEWIDIQSSIMRDGEALLRTWLKLFPVLESKVRLKTYSLPWWKANSVLSDDLSITLIGNVLNESAAFRYPKDDPMTRKFWEDLLNRNQGGGTLLLEPASRRISQFLSLLRNQIFDLGLLPREASSFWGPCLHAETCPLSDGRDWCHFSFPAQIPGRWFRELSVGLGSERSWLKFSYLWFSGMETRPPKPEPKLRRVVSDLLRPHHRSAQGPAVSEVLVCEPQVAGRVRTSRSNPLKRGDLIRLSSYRG